MVAHAVSNSTESPEFDFTWSRQARPNSPNDHSTGESIVVDKAGNVLVAGYFSGQATFGGTNLTAAGGDNSFVAKYDWAGNLKWLQQADVSLGVDGKSIAVDHLGNSFLVGDFRGNPRFGETTLTNVGSSNAFLVKYDLNGFALWAKQIKSEQSTAANAVVTDANTNCFIVGNFRGRTSFDSLSVSNGSMSAFLAKYDTLGNVIWVKQTAGTAAVTANGVGIDASGRVCMIGSFSGGAVNIGSFTLTNLSLADGIYAAQFDSDGTALWARHVGTRTAYEPHLGLAVAESGNIFIVGGFNNSLSIGPFTVTSRGSDDVFVIHLNSAGEPIWLKNVGGTQIDFTQSVAVDKAGNAYVTGMFLETGIFGDIIASGAGGFGDLFVTKFNPAGNILWVMRPSASTHRDVGVDIAADDNGNIFVTGYIQGTTTLGATTLTNGGWYDAFVAVSGPRLKAISIGENQLRLLWPTNSVGFTLQSTKRFNSQIEWIDSPTAPTVLGDQFVVTNLIFGGASAELFRLRK